MLTECGVHYEECAKRSGLVMVSVSACETRREGVSGGEGGGRLGKVR